MSIIATLLSAACSDGSKGSGTTVPDYGLTERASGTDCVVETRPDGVVTVVPLISQTNCYSDLSTLTPAAQFTPYSLKVQLWVDGEHKKRLFSIPEGTTIGLTATGAWNMPIGTITMKQFFVNDVYGDDTTENLLETRFFLYDDDDKWRGFTYQWRADHSDADLLDVQVVDEYEVIGESGSSETHRHLFPARANCLKCHPAGAGSVLGLHTTTMNSDYAYPNGKTDNQIRALNHAGYFSEVIDEASISSMVSAVDFDDASQPLYDRMRSYLHVNCSHCHQPEGSVVSRALDMRYETSLLDSAICSSLTPGAPDSSKLWTTVQEMAEVDSPQETTMPPLGSFTLDPAASVIHDWIASLTTCP